MKEIEEEGRRAIQYFDQLNKNPSSVEFEKSKENMSDNSSNDDYEDITFDFTFNEEQVPTT